MKNPRFPVAVQNPRFREAFGHVRKFAHHARAAGVAGRDVYRAVRDTPHENPSEELDTGKAERVYEMWHQKEPNNAHVLDTKCDSDDHMVSVGRAFSITYRSGKWEKGRKTNDYIHHFDSLPNVYMLGHLVADGMRGGGKKTVGTLLRACQNADGLFAVAELATPLSFCVEDGSTEGTEIAIHTGSKVYGAVDKKTVIITDPHWRLIVIKGGKMRFDERGIVY